jgi:transposase-like protein
MNVRLWLSKPACPAAEPTRTRRVQQFTSLACRESGFHPAAHQRRIRTTNRLERLTGEGRRRTKVIPRFPTERSCLSLLYATLVTASRRWRGVPMTPAMVRHLQNLRTETDAAAAKEAIA